MRLSAIFSVAVLALAALGADARAETILAGAESPVGNLDGPDGWYHILYIDETHPFDFSSTGQTAGFVTSFTLFAEDRSDRPQMVTPFVAEPLGPNDFIVRLIGTTRVEGTDWTADGLYTFVFDETATPITQDGWMAGFVSSNPDGSGGGSPVPYRDNQSSQDGWLTGSESAGATTPRIEVGLAPTAGGSGTWNDGLERFYQFNIGAVPTPEPAAAMFLLAGLVAVLARRRL